MASTNSDTATWKPSASSSHRTAAAHLSVLTESQAANQLIQAYVRQLAKSQTEQDPPSPSDSDAAPLSAAEKLDVGLAALGIFLQANVTGPVVPADKLVRVQERFCKAWRANSPSTSTEDDPTALAQLHKAALGDLEVDGVSPYSHVPYLELFSLARFVFEQCLTESSTIVEVSAQAKDGESIRYSLSWIRLRINIWHYKLLTQPSLGPGSNFTKSSQWSEVPSLVSSILDDMAAVRAQIAGDEVWSEAEAWNRDDRAYFLVESANNYILLGRHEQAKQALQKAAQATGLEYALSGALGKRTKFQENSVSQLVVLARSREGEDAVETKPEGREDDEEDDKNAEEQKMKPEALQLNDDTLLEEIQFSKDDVKDAAREKTLPPGLAELSPDEQPQLSPLDQIILLTEATLKDAFSPVDALTSQEILPFAVRVLTDQSTNWQIYTQALLVRSRIEVHRSRTVERGVLQLQAVADQVLTDTTVTAETVETQPETAASLAEEQQKEHDIPSIQISIPGEQKLGDSVPAISIPKPQVPTSFLPAPKSSESAPAYVRLRYIDALSTPPRWHLESELAYAWAGLGSLTSALEIFKRLRLWAEVALCYASAAASEDEDGRGSGGEEKAKAIIRWRLFHPTGEEASSAYDPDDHQTVEEVMRLKASQFQGPERIPPPPNAARLWCILGDLENDPSHYERAWTISKQRYSRAQKSLGEHYLAQKDMPRAQEAYKLATSVNRLSPDLWSRLGDICLRLGQFNEAAEAYGRSISSATDTLGGEGARTWSNLGSAFWSLYCEVTAEKKSGKIEDNTTAAGGGADDEEDDGAIAETSDPSHDPANLIVKSLAAFKKGASIAHDNWRIWDNVLTLAARLDPPSVPDMILAFTHILRIRKTEDALDIDILTALLQDVVLSTEKPAPTPSSVASPQASTIYELPRGSPQRLLTRLLEEEIVPLITHRADLWSLVSRLRAWRHDHAGAIDASERAWRAAVGASSSSSSSSSGSGLLPGYNSSSSASSADWTTDRAAWEDVVKHTDELVSVLENWGPSVESVGVRWKGKARSAIRSVMGKGRESWEGTEGWTLLEGLLEGLKAGS
ncbi:hypothetical protein E4U39_000994 [Claviceps sp. Clav50 group G5]|nr:hypothetical protein E4U39_000994 [Claviceps sp. Clav50 group G5]